VRGATSPKPVNTSMTVVRGKAGSKLTWTPNAAGLAAGEGKPHVQNVAADGPALSGGATMGSMTGWQALADQARPRACVPCQI